MVDYPIGDLIAERVRAMGVRPFYKRFKHDGVTGPNMATVYSDQGHGVRAPVVFYNRCNEAAAQLKPGDFDWKEIIAGGVRWFHSGGIFAALSSTTPELIIEGMKAAKAAGAVVSFDLNFRAKLWQISGGLDKAQDTMRRIVANVDVLVGNEEDLQKGLGLKGPEVESKSKIDPSAFFGHDGPRRQTVPQREGRRHDAARSSHHQPPRLERRLLDRRQDLSSARHASSTWSTASAAATASRPASSTACSAAHARRRAYARLGARRAAHHHVPRRHHDGFERSNQVQGVFAKGGSASNSLTV